MSDFLVPLRDQKVAGSNPAAPTILIFNLHHSHRDHYLLGNNPIETIFARIETMDGLSSHFGFLDDSLDNSALQKRVKRHFQANLGGSFRR